MNSKCVGIVAEYNPFHNGHAYQIHEAKRLSGAEYAIVCMSANFVQRGECACMDKFTRAAWALHGGADMVIELPDIISCSCAERFAYGSIKILKATGLVSDICFGSESGDIDALKATASLQPDKKMLKENLNKGYSYPNAITRALGKDEFLLPNDTLAVEYLRAIDKIAPTTGAYAVKRLGAKHDELHSHDEFSSASAIRADFSSGNYLNAKKALPPFVFEKMICDTNCPRLPYSMENLSDVLIYSLRKLGPNGISDIAEVTEGLENLIFNVAMNSNCGLDIAQAVKSKRYALARIRRIMVNAILGSTNYLQSLALYEPDSLYIRVLGVKNKLLLSELNKKAMLPVLVRSSDTKKLPENANRIFEHTRFASSVMSLAHNGERKAIDEFSNALITI